MKVNQMTEQQARKALMMGAAVNGGVSSRHADHLRAHIAQMKRVRERTVSPKPVSERKPA